MMNHLSRILSLLLLVSAAVFFSNCDGGDDPQKTEEEIQLEKFEAGQWTIQTVTNDGVNRTTEYPGMTLSFTGTFATGGTYQYSSNATSWPAMSPWEKSGTWKFVSGSVGSKIIRLTDDVEMTYAFTNSDKQLSLTFNYTGGGFDNGRVEKVEGAWSFIFTRP
jgi:hypothetical protein